MIPCTICEMSPYGVGPDQLRTCSISSINFSEGGPKLCNHAFMDSATPFRSCCYIVSVSGIKVQPFYRCSMDTYKERPAAKLMIGRVLVQVSKLLEDLKGKGMDLAAFEARELFEVIKGRTLW